MGLEQPEMTIAGGFLSALSGLFLPFNKMLMKRLGFFQLFTFVFFAFVGTTMKAQTAAPTVSFYDRENAAFVEMAEGDTKSTQAPCDITCKANLDYDMAYYDQVICEWKIYKENEGIEKPIVDRFEEEMTYTLKDSGGYGINLSVAFINTAEKDTVLYELEKDFSVVISESKLTCTDGLSPNGDDKNEKLKIECQSLVKVEGYILNRWGKKLHTFTLDNIAEGWDGIYNGKYVPDGGYLLYIDAIGSDGLHYKIKKVINVLKGYNDNAEQSSPGI